MVIWTNDRPYVAGNKQLVQLRQNYFIFLEYLKTGRGLGGGSNEPPAPVWIRHCPD